MEREKPTFDILGRIEKERAARNWSEYALAENSGLYRRILSAIAHLVTNRSSLLGSFFIIILPIYSILFVISLCKQTQLIFHIIS